MVTKYIHEVLYYLVLLYCPSYEQNLSYWPLHYFSIFEKKEKTRHSMRWALGYTENE